MSLSRQAAVDRWVKEVAVKRDFKPRRSYRAGDARSHTQIRGFEDRIEMDYRGRTWVLAQIYDDRGFIAINGDGIDRWQNAPGAAVQTMVREGIQNDVRLTSMVVPFQAVAGAGVDISTAKLIDIRADGWVQERHVVPPPPEEMVNDSEIVGPIVVKTAGLDGELGEGDEPELWFTYRRTWAHSAISYYSSPTEGGAGRGRGTLTGTAAGWRQIHYHEDSGQWEWRNRVHQLGESLFSAVSEDGRRHKWLSSFDRTEREPLYFLAQLPDGSGATTIEDATRALAPPIVHAAWEQGRIVERQGDVFFIPTDLSDDQIYKMSARRVRRECVIDPTPVRAGTRLEDWKTPIPGEVRSRVSCPCNCGHSRWSSDTPLGRRTLSIYGTAHTATEVVVTKEGRVYVRGTAHHDPQIIGENRRPDHQNKILGDQRKWYLAVRNTVPRRRTPRPVEVTEEVNA